MRIQVFTIIYFGFYLLCWLFCILGSELEVCETSDDEIVILSPPPKKEFEIFDVSSSSENEISGILNS